MGAIIVLVRIKISKPQVIKPLTCARIDLGKIFSEEIVIENPDFLYKSAHELKHFKF